jgi:hypothetical protein
MDLDAHVLNKSGEIKMGPPAWKLANVVVISGSGEGDYTTLASAFSAEGTNTTYLVDAEFLYEGDLTLPDNSALIGINRGTGGTVIAWDTGGTPGDPILVTGENCHVESIKFQASDPNNGGTFFAIRASGACDFVEVGIDITNEGGAGSNCYGVYISTGVTQHFDCDYSATGYDLGAGIYVAGITSRAYVFGGYVEGVGETTEWGIYSSNGIVATWNLPTIRNGIGGTLSSQSGQYNDLTAMHMGDEKLYIDEDGDSAIYSTTDDEVIHSAGGSDIFTTKGTGIHLESGKALYIDADGDSTIYSDTDDEVVHSAGTADIFTTKSVGIGMESGKDIYPDAATVGLQYRFEQMFGDDVPADPYHFTQRLFTLNNFTGHVAGFEDAQSSPYSFGGSPGGWAVGVPANTFARSDTWRHFLTLQNAAGTGVGLRWLDATGKNNIAIIGAAAPLWTSSDYNLCEIRMFDTTTPGGGSNYWAMRINWMGATYPDYPLRYGLWYGTGITYAWNNGTLVSFQAPMLGDGTVIRLKGIVTSGPSFFLTPSAAEGTDGVGISHTQASWPTVIKYAIVRLDINYTMFHVDEMRLY